MKNNYVETSIQKGFMSGTFEHAAYLGYLICQAKRNQRLLAVMSLDLRNPFGEVHHNLIPVVLAHHHMPDNIIKVNMSLYEDFASTIATDSLTTPFLHIKMVVFESLSVQLNHQTFIQFVLQEQFSQRGYSLTNLIRPAYWFLIYR